MTTLAPGLHIADRYRLDRRIAVGGMGEVWEASDTRLDRAVAVKVLRPELSGDEEFLHRFRIEARTVASLDHSGIALVHDYGEDDVTMGDRRTAYLVMELVRGEPLSNRISRGRMDADETLEVMEHAAWALDAAHQRGFVHRDVKPGNILLREDGVVKLTDFGIAKAANAVPVTRSGMVMGTAHYIAPEQASGGEAGPAGDVYSLGIVGYECLAGKRPFRAENPVVVAMMQVRDAPPPLPDDVPENVRTLIEAVLVKDPMHRYRDGAELARAIAAVRRGEPLPRPSRMPDDVELPGSAPASAAGDGGRAGTVAGGGAGTVAGGESAPEAERRRASRRARTLDVGAAFGRRGADEAAPAGGGRRVRVRGRAAHRADEGSAVPAGRADTPASPIASVAPVAPVAAAGAPAEPAVSWPPRAASTGEHGAPESPAAASPPAHLPPTTVPPHTPAPQAPPTGAHALVPPGIPSRETWHDGSGRPSPRRRPADGPRHAATPASPSFPASVSPGSLGPVSSPVAPSAPVPPPAVSPPPAAPAGPGSDPAFPPASAVETTIETTATSARLAATGPVATPERPTGTSGGAHRLADDHEPVDAAEDGLPDRGEAVLDTGDTPSRAPGSEPVSLAPRSRSRSTALVVLFVVLAVVAVLVTLLLLLPRLTGSSSAMSEPSGFTPGSVSRQEGVAMGWTAHRVGGTGDDGTGNIR